MFKSDQVTLGESARMGDDLFAADAGGRMRSSYFSFTAPESLPKGTIIHLATLMPGTMRIHGGISMIDTKIPVSFGHLGYIDHVGKSVDQEPNAFDKAVEGPILSRFSLNSLFMRTQTGLGIAVQTKGIAKKGATIEGVIYYTGN